MRPPAIHHCTSEPYRFFGRAQELALLDEAVRGGPVSVATLIGPGGQGKTAIVQHWLEPVQSLGLDGLFFWSFYRGKDSDLCLRSWYGYAEGLAEPPEVSASYCVDRLLPLLRRERWAVILDGTEVVQHESGPWFGRFLHPELGRLIEDLASEPLPGVVILTSRFPMPTLSHRRHARTLMLSALDPDSARGLLRSLGVEGTDAALDAAAHSCGLRAKAVELLGTFVRRFRGGMVQTHDALPDAPPMPDASPEEQHVAQVLHVFQRALPQETQDILALATAFRQPPTERQLLDYLVSSPVHAVLHQSWHRSYVSFAQRPTDWLQTQIDDLVHLRLLERVAVGASSLAGPLSLRVLDAHPLVRRGFEHVLGPEGRRHSAQARAGFLRGRPDRQPPTSLEQAREEIELFHAYCDAGLWNEADGVYVALDNPKHRFLAPAAERDLLLRFFPDGDWRIPPLWAGFGRRRSLAICFELLGQYDDALAAYPPADAPLRGDALIALGRLRPLLDQAHAASPWQTLWHAYRAHALCLAGQTDEALSLARSLVPVDVYEWVHVFECLLRAGALSALDLSSMLYRPPHSVEHPWAWLARRRMRADFLRVTQPATADLGGDYAELLEAYDRAGMSYERALSRLGYARLLLAQGRHAEAASVNAVTRDLATRHGMRLVLLDAWELDNMLDADSSQVPTRREQIVQMRHEVAAWGIPRP